MRWKVDLRGGGLGGRNGTVVLVSCEAAAVVEEEDASETSREKFEYQAEVGAFYFFYFILFGGFCWIWCSLR